LSRAGGGAGLVGAIGFFLFHEEKGKKTESVIAGSLWFSNVVI